jgi:hypothetical protein
VHAHARADGQFWPPWSIKCLDLHLWHKYQANPMQNNEVIVHWNIPKFNTFACVHVHAHAGQLFWPCRAVGDLNIYLLFKFEWIWTENKKVSFARFYVQKFKHTCTRVHAFSEKNDYRSEHLQMLDYHPGKFHADPLSSFWEHSRTKKYRRRIIMITRNVLVASNE